MKESKIFVFGASGFIGTHLVQYLEPNRTVYKIGREDSDIKFDLGRCAPDALAGKVSSGDTFIFLAGISSPEICNIENDYAYKINVTKTIELINWLTKQSIRVLYCSSDAVFGNIGRIAHDFDHLAPLGEYAGMKTLVERSCVDNEFVKIARFSYVLGGKDKFSQMLIKAERKGELVRVFRGFDRNVVLLDDILEGLEAMINKWTSFDFRAVNFSGPKLVSRVELVKVIKRDILTDLDFEVTDAPSGFWTSRAKSIATGCKNFSIILEREPRGLSFIREVW
jgi:nucleoside-diphosphate-sugar epimerase